MHHWLIRVYALTGDRTGTLASPAKALTIEIPGQGPNLLILGETPKAEAELFSVNRGVGGSELRELNSKTTLCISEEWVFILS